MKQECIPPTFLTNVINKPNKILPLIETQEAELADNHQAQGL